MGSSTLTKGGAARLGQACATGSPADSGHHCRHVSRAHQCAKLNAISLNQFHNSLIDTPHITERVPRDTGQDGIVTKWYVVSLIFTARWQG